MIKSKLQKRIKDEFNITIRDLISHRPGYHQRAGGALSWSADIKEGSFYHEIGSYETMSEIVRAASIDISECTLTAFNRLLIVGIQEG